MNAELWAPCGEVLARDGDIVDPRTIRFDEIDRTGWPEFVCIVEGGKVTQHARIRRRGAETVLAGNAAVIHFHTAQSFGVGS